MLKPGKARDYRDRDFGVQKAAPARAIAFTRFEILRDVVKRFQRSRENAIVALEEIRDKKLYVGHYESFEECCLTEFGWSRAHAYRLLEAENVKESVGQVSPLETNVNESLEVPATEIIANEYQARELAKALPEERVEVLKDVAKTGPVTAKRIAKAVDARKPKPLVIDVKLEPAKTRTTCSHCGGTGYED